MSTILQIINADRNLSTMLKALKASGIEELLNEHGPFTLIAPVNLAFGNLSPDSLEELMKPANHGKLKDLLSNHILKEKKLFRQFYNGQKLTALNGKEINVTVIDGDVRLNNAKILARDMQGANGVLHSVDVIHMPVNPLYIA